MSGYKRCFGAIMAKHDAQVFFDEVPEIKNDEMLLKMEAINICTTDYQQWMGLRDHQGFPMAAGHEFCGIIIEKGEDVIDDFQIGDRVSLAYDYCGICEDCRTGRTMCCEHHNKPTLNPDGFLGRKRFANYSIVNQKFAVKLSKDLPAGEACFLEPTGTVVSGIRKVRAAINDTAAIVGCGTMGLLNAQVAKAFGSNVIMLDISEKKVERAKAMNIGPVINSKETDPVEAVKQLTNGKGVDIVIPCVGNTLAYKQAYQMMRRIGGRMLLFAAGYPKPELEIDPNELHYRRLEIMGTGGGNASDFQLAAELLNSRRINASYSLENKVIGLKNINDAFAAAAMPDAYRVTVDLQDI